MNASLLGTWELQSYELRPENGSPTYPLGVNATGFISYTPDGFMSVVLMAANRKEFKSGDFMDGTIEEKASAMDSFILKRSILIWMGMVESDDC